MKRFLVSYRHDGGQWNVELPAADLADAKRRLSQMTFGKVEGEIVARMPGKLGPLAALAAAVRNSLSANR